MSDLTSNAAEVIGLMQRGYVLTAWQQPEQDTIMLPLLWDKARGRSRSIHGMVVRSLLKRGLIEVDRPELGGIVRYRLTREGTWLDVG